MRRRRDRLSGARVTDQTRRHLSPMNTTFRRAVACLCLSLGALLLSAAPARAADPASKTQPTTKKIIVPAPEVAMTPPPASPPPSEAGPRPQLLLGALGGALFPFSVLGAGVKAEAVAEVHLATMPLGATLGIGYERHTATTRAMFAPPAGGYDPNAIENQTLVPIELALVYSPLRDELSRVQVGAGYGLIPTFTQAQSLGSTASESGLGQEASLEAGYTRKVGPVELLVRARYALRHTAVGARTAVMELSWYQSAGILVGCGFGI
jgi:hypothetical protein